MSKIIVKELFMCQSYLKKKIRIPLKCIKKKSEIINLGSIYLNEEFILFYVAGFGHTTDRKTRLIAQIMLVSMIPVIILQLTKMINSSTWTRVIIILALIIIVSLLIAHGLYQVRNEESFTAPIRAEDFYVKVRLNLIIAH